MNVTKELFRNPAHHFGYIQLPPTIDVDFSNDPDAMCWDPFNLIAREIYASEVDVVVKLGKAGREIHLGKAISIKTTRGMRYLRLDSTECDPEDFWVLVQYCHRKAQAVPHASAYFVSMHMNHMISEIRIRASTIPDDEGITHDAVLNQVVITLIE